MGVSVSSDSAGRCSMPLFKNKPDKEHKKILQNKLVLAEQKPDDIFDLSECGIYEVPDGVFSKFKVWNKGVLLLQNNFLKEMKQGGELLDLNNIKILDLSHNVFENLPKAIKHLTNIQRLDLAHNKLKKLPDEIGELRHLQILNLQGNLLSGLPAAIKFCQHLQHINILDNKYLLNLPASLCYLQQLKEFHFDLERITYPNKEITRKGILEIQRFFKQLKGDEFMNENLSPASSSSSSPPSHTSPLHGDDTDGAAFEESIAQREMEKERVKQERLRLEGEILTNQTVTAMNVVNEEDRRQQLLKVISDQDNEQNTLVKKFAEGNDGRNRLLTQLYLEENHLDKTVNLVLQMGERAKHTEELLDNLEKEQARIDQLVQITQEEADRLRREEVIRSMAVVLEDMRHSKETWNSYEASRNQLWDASLRSTTEADVDVTEIMRTKDRDQKEIMNNIVKEEEKQRQAFQCLQFQKDSKLGRIRQQIEMIESELQKLSILEIERRKEKQEQDINQLAEMRMNTAVMLSNLINEQEQRENLLKSTMQSMEEKREGEQQDYWLIQYQRLLDSKPKILIDKVNKLDVFVVEVVLNGNGREYLPMFARHSIDEEAMQTIDDKTLADMGIHSAAARASILQARDSALHIECSRANYVRQSSAPRMVSETTDAVSTVEDFPISSFAGNTECVVCLDRTPDVIFLKCGHVCTCSSCCPPLDLCPLCRQEIVQKCRLYTS